MWVLVYAWTWAAQQRHDMPEEYGLVETFQHMLNGQLVIKETVTQPQDWWDDGVLRRAGTRIYYLAGSL